MTERFLVTKRGRMKTGHKPENRPRLIQDSKASKATDDQVNQLAQAIVDRLTSVGIMVGPRSQQVEPPRQRPAIVNIDRPALKRDTGMEASRGEIKTKEGPAIAQDIADQLKKVLGGKSGTGTDKGMQ